MTRLETAAWKNFQEFWKDISKIWQTYKRYGESVLEADLEEGDEKFKPLFTNSKKDDNLFEENVRKYWRENYHFVAGSYEELSKMFSHVKQRNNLKYSLILLPETSEYHGDGENGDESTYAIEETLYKAIKSKLKTSRLENLILINCKEERALTIEFSHRAGRLNYAVIVSECKKEEIIMI